MRSKATTDADRRGGSQLAPSGAPRRAVRVLILATNATLAEQVENALRTAAPAFVSNRVGGQDAFIEALDSFKPDIVLLEDKTPQFDGRDVLEYVSRTHPEIPVFIVMRTRDEDAALNLLKAGARDYVFAGNLSCLPLIVRPVIAERHALRQSEERFRTLVESFGNYVWQTDANGVYTYASPGVMRVLGYSPAELAGKTPFDMMSAGEATRVAALLEPFTNAKRAFSMIEKRVRHRDGHEMVFETGGIPVVDESGAFQGYYGIDRDITARKSAERAVVESEAKLRTILDNTADGLLVADTQTRKFVLANNAMCRMLGYSAAELTALGIDDIHPPEALADVRQEFEHLAKGEAQTAHDLPVKRKDGSIFYATITGSPLPIDGRTYTVGVFRDVTDRRQADNILRASEQRFRAIYDSVNDGIIVHDLETAAFLDINPRVCEMFGYTRDEILKLDIDGISADHSPALRERALQLVKLAASGHPQIFEWQVKAKDGHLFWVEVALRRVTFGDLDFLISTAHDITDRKLAADALAYRDRILHAVTVGTAGLVAAEVLAEGMAEALKTVGEALDVDRVIVLAERPGEPTVVALEYIWERRDIAVSMQTKELPSFLVDDSEVARWHAPLREGKPVITHTRNAPAAIRPLFEHNQNKSVLLMPIFSGGEFWGNIGLDACRTEREWTSNEIDVLQTFADVIGIVILRNRTRLSLRQSEERFRAVSETAQDAILMTDTTGRVQYWNPAAEKTLGYTSDEAKAKPAIIDWLVPPRIRARVAPEMADFLATGRPSGVDKVREFAAMRKDGSECPIELSLATVVLGNERLTVAILHDITERKTAETVLRASEAQLSTALQMARAGAWVYDVAKDEFTFNDNFYRIFHTTADAVGGYTIRSADYAKHFCHPDDMTVVARETAAAIDTPDPNYSREIEHRILYADGEVGYITVRFFIVKDASGKTIRTYGVNQDITERVRAIEAIAYRGELLRSVTLAAAELLTVGAFDETVRHILQVIGESVHADRVVMLEMQKRGLESAALIFRYAWHAPNVPVILDESSFTATLGSGPEFEAFFAPLADGKPVMEVFHTTTGPVRRLFEGLAMKSLLIVPVVVDGRPWGLIGFDDCRTERQWSSVEIDILHTLADLIGTAIQRERYVAELSDANRIVQNSPTILYRMRGEPSLPMIYVSHNITLLGYDAAEIVSSPQFYKSLIHPDDQAAVRDSMVNAVTRRGGHGVVEFRMRTARGDYLWMENRYTPIRDTAGRLLEIEGILVDITQRKEAEERIAILARTDALTGLANRSTFIEQLRKAFASARRGATAFAVLYIDLDRFKDINDTHGHLAGDSLLRTIADRLKGVVRGLDLIARLGGDEFGVLQAQLTDLSQAGALATTISHALAKPLRLGNEELHVTVSIGISPYTPELSGPEEMLAHADLALYRAKDEGRDQYRFHSPDLDEQVRERVAMGEDLRHALDHNEFELYYQPQVELLTGRIVGMEALLRWNHPTRGFLLPDSFLPIAEKTGIIVGIGQWALEQACKQMHLWQKAGIGPDTLAVNLSVLQLKGGAEFVALVQSTLARWELSANVLELDVTESMLAHATFAQNDVLVRLQALGVKIAIDDFGTQYSSLDYLKTYHVGRLKIPRELITGGTQNPRDAATVRAIIGIARELNIEVVAQGVENEAQQALLTSAPSTTRVQGFYYSQPVPPARAEVLLRQKSLEPQEEQQTGSESTQR